MEPQPRHDDAVAIPEPAWWSNTERTTRRPTLSRDVIVDAALVVLDRHGLDGLSMRRVAEELETGAASLYWHVANKEQLLNVILDRVIGEIPLPPPDPEKWREQLQEMAHEGRAAFRRYRDVARASLGRVPMGPNLLRVVEWQLALLRGAGVPPAPAAWFGDLFALYIAAHAFEDSMAGEGSPEEEAAAMGAYLASLPADRFPHLMASMGDLSSGSAEDRFEFGLELILRGLATFIEPVED